MVWKVELRSRSAVELLDSLDYGSLNVLYGKLYVECKKN